MSALFVGYGSLLSARGLGPQLGGVRDAWRVWLAAPRRFGKPPQAGGRLAMEVVSARALYTGHVLAGDAGQPAGAGCGALLLEVAAAGIADLVRREGYDPRCWAALAAASPEGVAERLCRLAAEAGDDARAYRAALWAISGPTRWSAAHYLPHPVRLACGRAACVFVAPDPGETGDPALPSCKEAHPGLVPAGLDRVYEVGPGGIPDWCPRKQDHYVELCLLGLAHGVALADLLGAGLAAAHPSRALLRAWRADSGALAAERAALRAAVPALARERDYAARFAPDLETAWRWSGLGLETW
ncbi:MAG: hypothetical protein AB7N76_03420 [Planctomycetota bacterium]